MQLIAAAKKITALAVAFTFVLSPAQLSFAADAITVQDGQSVPATQVNLEEDPNTVSLSPELQSFLDSAPTDSSTYESTKVLSSPTDSDSSQIVSITDNTEAEEARLNLNLATAPNQKNTLVDESACTNAVPANCTESTGYYIDNNYVGKKITRTTGDSITSVEWQPTTTVRATDLTPAEPITVSVSSIDVSAGATNATVNVNLSGSSSDLTVKVWDSNAYTYHSWGWSGYAPQSETTISCSASCSATLDGLNPNTSYVVEVVSANSGTSVNLSGNTSASFTTSYDYTYYPASTSIYVSSVDVSAGSTDATVNVNLSGNYSDITLEVRDASNNIQAQTSLYCYGYCSTSIGGLSPNSYYTVNVLTNGSNYVSGTSSTSFGTAADTSYSYYYDTTYVDPSYYGSTYIDPVSITNYVDIQSLNVSVSDSNPNVANVNFYNYGNTSSNLVLRLKDSVNNQLSETYLNNCYSYSSCSQDIDISGLAQGQTYYVEVASNDYNYVSFSGTTSTSFTVPQAQQLQVEGTELEQTTVVLDINKDSHPVIYKRVETNLVCDQTPCYDTRTTYSSADGSYLGKMEYNSSTPEVTVWTTSDNVEVEFVSGNVLSETFVIERGNYFYAIKKNEDGTYTSSPALKQHALSESDHGVTEVLGMPAYSHQQSSGDIACNWSGCSGVTTIQTDYYSQGGAYLGRLQESYDAATQKTSFEFFDAVGNKLITRGTEVPAELAGKAATILGKTPVTMLVDVTASPCMENSDGTQSNCATATIRQFFDSTGAFIGKQTISTDNNGTIEAWFDATDNIIQIVNGSMNDSHFVIQRGAYFYAIQKNADGTFSSSEALKPFVLTDVIKDAEKNLGGTPAYSYQTRGGTGVGCTQSIPQHCFGTEISTTLYYSSTGLYLGDSVHTYDAGAQTTTALWHDANGNEIKPDEVSLPPAVAAYQNAFGDGLTVSITTENGVFSIRVTDSKEWLMRPTSGLQELSFTVREDGTLANLGDGGFDGPSTTLRISATYYGANADINVDAQLLFEGLRQLLINESTVDNGEMISARYITDMETLVEMTKISVTQVEGGAIYFSRGENSYKAFRNESGQAVFEEQNDNGSLPPAIVNYIQAIRDQFEKDGTRIGLALQADGTFLVTIDRSFQCPEGMMCTMVAPAPGSFGSISLKLSADGKRVPESMNVDYNGVMVSGKDADLLFDAMSACPQGEICYVNFMADSDATIFSKMTQVQVTQVESGSIYFTKDSVDYKAYRDASNVVVLEKINSQEPQITAVKSTLQADIMKNFGFSESQMKEMLQNGLIKFEVDLAKLTAKAVIDPSLTLPEGAVNLFNPLGSNKLPGEINYTLGLNPIPMIICAEGVTCKQPDPTYHLVFGNFKIGDEFKSDLFDISYMRGDAELNSFNRVGDNRLYSVKVTRMDNPCGNNMECMAPASLSPLKNISFTYDDTNAQMTAHILYQDGSQGDVISRDVVIAHMGNGSYRIQSIADMDKDGKVLVKSNFEYELITSDCAAPPEGEESSCQSITVIILRQIVRADAEGNTLSTISGIELDPTKAVLLPQVASYHATQKLPDNGSMEGLWLELHFQNFEEMLSLALKNELAENTKIDEMRAELLRRTEAEIAANEEAMATLGNRLAEAERMLEAKKLEINASVETLIQSIKEALLKLEEALNSDDIRTPTRIQIEAQLAEVRDYLDNTVNNEVEALIQYTVHSFRHLLDMEAAGRNNHAQNLTAYRNELQNAASLEALRELEGKFPELFFDGIYIEPGVDPIEKMNAFLVAINQTVEQVKTDKIQFAMQLSYTQQSIALAMQASMQIPPVINQDNMPAMDRKFADTVTAVRAAIARLATWLQENGYTQSGESAPTEFSAVYGPQKAKDVERQAMQGLANFYENLMMRSIQITSFRGNVGEKMLVPVSELVNALIGEMEALGLGRWSSPEDYLKLKGLTAGDVGDFNPGDGVFMPTVFENIMYDMLPGPSLKDLRNIVIRFISRPANAEKFVGATKIGVEIFKTLLQGNLLSFPEDVLAAARANLSESELAMFEAARADIADNTVYAIQMSEDGKTTTWSWTSASNNLKTYQLTSRTLSDGSARWEFSTTQRVALQDLVNMLINNPALSADEQAALQTALEAMTNDMISPTAYAFTQNEGFGKYTWVSKSNPNIIHVLENVISTSGNSWQFKTTTLLSFPEDVLAAARANLSEFELAMFEAARADIGDNTQYSTQTDIGGKMISWTWTSGSEPNKTYHLTSQTLSDGNVEWNFSIRERLALRVFIDSLMLTLPDADRAALQAALDPMLNDMISPTAYTFTPNEGMGKYTWVSKTNPNISYEIVNIVTESSNTWSFRKIEALGFPDDVLAAARANLSEFELAQFEAARADIDDSTTYSKQTSEDGKLNAWIWTSGSNSNKIYRLESQVLADGSVEWTFSVTEKIITWVLAVDFVAEATRILGQAPVYQVKTETRPNCSGEGDQMVCTQVMEQDTIEYFDADKKSIGRVVILPWDNNRQIWYDANWAEIKLLPENAVVITGPEQDLALSALELNTAETGTVYKTTTRTAVNCITAPCLSDIITDKFYSQNGKTIGFKVLQDGYAHFYAADETGAMGELKQSLELVENPEDLDFVKTLLMDRTAEYRGAFWVMWEQMRASLTPIYTDQEEEDERRKRLQQSSIG